jgi:RNA polymerase sigma-70 factor (ECF subfamily)
MGCIVMKPKNKTEKLDSDLVKKARDGSRDAFGSLIEQTQSRLFRFCVVLCKSPVQAEEICQETYLRAFQKIKELNQDSLFFDWLLKIAKNIFLDQVRSADHRLREHGEVDFEALGLEERDLSELLMVRDALSQFETEDQYLLILVDLEERTYEEAAKIMGISEDTVRSRLFRLRKIFLENWKKAETK